jgi:hypothetical protein
MAPLTPVLRQILDTIARETLTRPKHIQLQEDWGPYCCFGCFQGDLPNLSPKLLKPATITRKLTANERREVLNLLLVPHTRAAVAAEVGFWLTPWAYFPQAYEAGVQGPGAVIGLSRTAPEVTLAQGLQFWLWQDAATYLPRTAMGKDAEIAEKLWQLAQQRCGAGLVWLTRKQNYSQAKLTQAIRDEVQTLLGVPPLQQVVAKRLNRNWQLSSLTTIEVRG